jgi:hypothetical protein
MCMCDKPTINGEPGYSWDGKTFSTRQPAPPDLASDDTLIFDEAGRCGGLDCHSHHFRVVKTSVMYWILVRHGGGNERFNLPTTFRLSLPALQAMTSNERYWLLHTIYSTRRDGEQYGAGRMDERYRAAFAEGRLKKRKMPGRAAFKIWIESKPAEVKEAT